MSLRKKFACCFTTCSSCPTRLEFPYLILKPHMHNYQSDCTRRRSQFVLCRYKMASAVKAVHSPRVSFSVCLERRTCLSWEHRKQVEKARDTTIYADSSGCAKRPARRETSALNGSKLGHREKGQKKKEAPTA